jgi:hypothetical protein
MRRATYDRENQLSTTEGVLIAAGVVVLILVGYGIYISASGASSLMNAFIAANPGVPATSANLQAWLQTPAGQQALTTNAPSYLPPPTPQTPPVTPPVAPTSFMGPAYGGSPV